MTTRRVGHAGIFRYSFLPVAGSFFYFWATYLLYLIRPAWSLELNYLFEDHAYRQYSLFLAREGGQLSTRPIDSAYLAAYGRHPRSEYEFFASVRNDELVHRNRSIREIELHAGR